MPNHDARWGIQATMGQFFPDSVFEGPDVEEPFEQAREFYAAHSKLIKYGTKLVSRLTLPPIGKPQLRAEKHLTSELAARTVSLGFVAGGGRGRLGWIISGGNARYDVSLHPWNETITTLYVRTNQNSLLRRESLTSAAAQAAVYKAVAYLAGHRDTECGIAELEQYSQTAQLSQDEILAKQAAGESLTKVESDARDSYKPICFPPGPWVDMRGKTPLLSS